QLINLALVATPGGGGAELYPQCIQLSVQGNGHLVPQSSDYVHFPGAYKATDPGLTFAPGDQQKSQYQIPGGPLATLVLPANLRKRVPATPLPAPRPRRRTTTRRVRLHLRSLPQPAWSQTRIRSSRRHRLPTAQTPPSLALRQAPVRPRLVLMDPLVRRTHPPRPA
ncbi:hypothetical protein LXA43DRAFT_1010842, partial [Ganoderma leucocontextum]